MAGARVMPVHIARAWFGSHVQSARLQGQAMKFGGRVDGERRACHVVDISACDTEVIEHVVIKPQHIAHTAPPSNFGDPCVKRLAKVSKWCARGRAGRAEKVCHGHGSNSFETGERRRDGLDGMNMESGHTSIKRIDLTSSFSFSDRHMNAPSTPRLPLLDLDLLRTLVAINDTGSLSGAAAVVHRTPSAISMQVKKIEELLDRPVLVRDSRSVSFTRDGAFLLEHARRMLALNRDAVSRFVQPDVQGVVRLGAPDDAAERLLPGMLRRFAETHPCVTVDVVVDHTSRMIEAYNAGRLDMTLITCEAGFKEENAEVIMRERLAWMMRRGSLAVEQDPLPVSVWEESCVWRKAGLDALDAQGRTWRIAFQSGHISGQRAAILADLAVAPLPVSAAQGDIIEVPKKYGLPELPKYAIGLLSGKSDNPAVEAAANHLRAAYAQV